MIFVVEFWCFLLHEFVPLYQCNMFHFVELGNKASFKGLSQLTSTNKKGLSS